MPRVTKNPWSYHWYFSPLICQSVFPPERAITPLPLTQHKIFPPEDVPITEAEEVVQTRNPISQTKVLIRKLRGEISRINRGGYNLCDTLGWPAADYEEIRINNSSRIAWTADPVSYSRSSSSLPGNILS